jgi:glycosyltransferase involved in cell wall biosynthesis
MENKIAISVIVPAYNAEQVVENCVRSIMNQTMKEIEIIIVEDGSKDNTRRIVENLAQEDVRIQLILKDVNEGLSAGRNSAMQVAKGEYIGFVDADDWVESDWFETLYKEGNQADLIVAGYLHDAMDESRNTVNVSRTVKMQQGEWTDKKCLVAQAANVDTAKMFAYTWNKLYKRTLIEEASLSFSKQVLIEDFIFNTYYWDMISSLKVVDFAGYHYIKASKDALTQKFLPDFLDIMNLRFQHIKSLLEKNEVYVGVEKAQLSNVHIKHAIAGVVRNCSPKGNYSWKEQLQRVRNLLRDEVSKEAMKYAKGSSKQEKCCNFVFKTKSALLVLLLGKMIYMMQTKSKTAFDKMK